MSKVDSCLDCTDCRRLSSAVNNRVVIHCNRYDKPIGDFERDSKELFSLAIPAFCLSKGKQAEVYNKKAFLAPESLLSMSSYHAKVFPDQTYIFRIHDCHNGIRFRGDLKDATQAKECVEKLRRLQSAIADFCSFVEREYADQL